MSSTPFPNISHWWFPIGNTPAIDLLRDRKSDEVGTVKVLCLAAGDPRSILYTLHCEFGFGRSRVTNVGDDEARDGSILRLYSRADPHAATVRKYDIATCDYEPAVLARNLLLYTSLADIARRETDDVPKAHFLALWNIFYHFVITEDNPRALRRHAQKLADQATSKSKWKASAYGNLFSFTDDDTLDQVRLQWTKYADSKSHQNKGDDLLEKVVDNRKRLVKEQFGSGLYSFHTLRSAGAHHDGSVDVLSQSLAAYSQTGVVAGNRDDLVEIEKIGNSFANPTFVAASASTDLFTFHHGSDPVDGFHLVAKIFDEDVSVTTGLRKVAQEVKTQFVDWCKAFVHMVRNKRIHLRFHCGDAISLCFRVQECIPSYLTRSMSCVSPFFKGSWTCKRLSFSDTAQLLALPSFDVIDTSNLSDLVGLPIVLSAAGPLLGSTQRSVLYTETLIRHSEQGTELLDVELGADTTTVAVLTGFLSPEVHVGETADSNGPDRDSLKTQNPISSGGADQQYRCRRRTSWRYFTNVMVDRGHQCDGEILPVKIGPKEDYVSVFLANLYRNLYSTRNQRTLSDELRDSLDLGCGRESIEEMESLSAGQRVLHNSFAFVAFIRLIANNCSRLGALLESIENAG